MLAAAIKQRVDTVAHALTPPGGRAPFTRKLSARDAFDWWLKHRYDAIGMSEFAKLTAIQQQELDTWLAQAVQGTGAGQQQPIPPVNDVNAVLRPAQIQERKLEGPPVTADVS